MARSGSALLAAIVGLLLIELIAIAGVTLARGAVVDAGVRARTLQARLEAESAVNAALADWTAERFDTLPPGTIRMRTWPDGGRSEVERIGGAWHVRGFSALAGARPRLELRVHTLPRDSLAALLDAALHVHSPTRLLSTATIDGSGPTTVCPPLDQPRPGIIAPSADLAVDAGAQVAGSPPIEGGSAVTHMLAGLPLQRIARLADHGVGGVITPAPLDDGTACVPADTNWGEPAGTGSCADRMMLIAAPGDLTIAGGRGQGVLSVAGTLRMIGDAAFHGVVLAGALDLGDAVIRGAVRTIGSDTSYVAGRIVFDGCAVRRALDAPALRRPFARGRAWLPVR